MAIPFKYMEHVEEEPPQKYQCDKAPSAPAVCQNCVINIKSMNMATLRSPAKS